jgi:hypothetical protein
MNVTKEAVATSWRVEGVGFRFGEGEGESWMWECAGDDGEWFGEGYALTPSRPPPQTNELSLDKLPFGLSLRLCLSVANHK